MHYGSGTAKEKSCGTAHSTTLDVVRTNQVIIVV
jgi:hypothetical protein